MADTDGISGRRSAGRLAVFGAIAIVVVAGLALAVARPWHHGNTVGTPMQRSVSAWTQDHPETWAWMQSHWDEMSVMHEHWGDTAWMQTHVADWGWMQDHWDDVSWMHGHWEGMAWMHAGGMMAGSGSGGMMGQ
jgi:hypothetical protein